MTKVSRPSYMKSNRTVKKLTVKRLRWNICETSSSSDDDIIPILPEHATLPETSSDELSTIEESHLEDGDSSTSEYMSSQVFDDLSNHSSLSEDDMRDYRQKKTGNFVQNNQTNSFQSDRNENVQSVDAIVQIDWPRDEIIDVPSSSTEQTSEVDMIINPYYSPSNLAHVLMNLALFAANSNQLFHLLENFEDKPVFYVILTFIIASLIIQFLVKICLIINCRYNANIPAEARKALRMNNLITAAILVITFVNVAITSVIMFRSFNR